MGETTYDYTYQNILHCELMQSSNIPQNASNRIFEQENRLSTRFKWKNTDYEDSHSNRREL